MRTDGGLTHIKYDHYYYPRIIELKCPNCRNYARAINETVPNEIEYFMDIARFGKIWNFKCVSCIKEYEINWSEIQKIDLWYKIQVRNETVWSWNAKHLDLIIKRLKSENIKNHSWAFFATYINKKWLEKIKKKSDIQKLENYLIGKIKK